MVPGWQLVSLRVPCNEHHSELCVVHSHTDSNTIVSSSHDSSSITSKPKDLALGEFHTRCRCRVAFSLLCQLFHLSGLLSSRKIYKPFHYQDTAQTTSFFRFETSVDSHSSPNDGLARILESISDSERTVMKSSIMRVRFV